MKRLYGAVAVSAGLLALAACSDTTAVTSSSVDLAPSYSKNVTPEDAQESHVHYVPLASNAAEAAARREARQSARSGNTGITYHGGPVLQAGTKVVAIYWASSTIYNNGPAAGTKGTSDGSLIGFFLSHEGGTPYFGINSSYTDGSGHAIANSVTYSGYWANNTNAPSGTTKVTDAQMIAMLQSGFGNGNLTYDPSTLYVIFTSGKVNLGGGFGTQYCGYHTHGTVTINGVAKTALYAALPYDYAYPGSCTNGTASPNADPGADAELSVLAHEVEETTTDMMGNAWYDSRGYENADKCAWTWGTTYNNGKGVANVNIAGKDFLIQQNWKNVSGGGCAMHL